MGSVIYDKWHSNESSVNSKCLKLWNSYSALIYGLFVLIFTFRSYLNFLTFHKSLKGLKTVPTLTNNNKIATMVDEIISFLCI